MMNISDIKEMQPYLNEPKAMPVGTVGKVGYLRMCFELDSEGRSILRELERRAPIIVQQELYFDEEMPEMPCVYILSSGGPNVDGDRYSQEFIIRKDAFAHISTGAATKLAEMQYNFSGMTQIISLESGAYMEYIPEPIIPCKHTRFASDTTIRIASSATLFYSEIYTCGRKYFGCGERFAYDILSVCTKVERDDGTMLFRDKFIIRPEEDRITALGVMDGYDIFANVIVATPSLIADSIYDCTSAFIDRQRHITVGITRLPYNCGLSFKVLGNEVEPVKDMVRNFCSTVRLKVKGRAIFNEFPWR